MQSHAALQPDSAALVLGRSRAAAPMCASKRRGPGGGSGQVADMKNSVKDRANAQSRRERERERGREREGGREGGREGEREIERGTEKRRMGWRDVGRM